MRTKGIAVAITNFAATIMICGGAFAQAVPNSQDTGFVRKNMRDNMHEIRMAEMAIEKDVRQDIKNVAITIRDDHKQMLNELATFATESNMTSVTESEMNISQDTVGIANESSGNTGVGTRNRRDDAQSADESRNKAGKKKATREADAGKPSGNRKDKSTDQSTANHHSTDTGHTGSHPGMTAEMDEKNQHQMDSLMQASGKEFETMWVAQMIPMHEQKLTELQSASQSLSSDVLKQQATKAIPKIRKHLQLLQSIKK